MKRRSRWILISIMISLLLVTASCSSGATKYAELSKEIDALADKAGQEFVKMNDSLVEWSSSDELTDVVTSMSLASETCRAVVRIESEIVEIAVEMLGMAPNDEHIVSGQKSVDAYSLHLEKMQSLESALNQLSLTQRALHSLSLAVNAIDSQRRSETANQRGSNISAAMNTMEDMASPLESGALEGAIGSESAIVIADMISLLRGINATSAASDAIWTDEVDEAVLDSVTVLSELKVKTDDLVYEVMREIESISPAINRGSGQ